MGLKEFEPQFVWDGAVNIQAEYDGEVRCKCGELAHTFWYPSCDAERIWECGKCMKKTWNTLFKVMEERQSRF
jgi:hypothetical protein